MPSACDRAHGLKDRSSLRYVVWECSCPKHDGTITPDTYIPAVGSTINAIIYVSPEKKEGQITLATYLHSQPNGALNKLRRKRNPGPGVSTNQALRNLPQLSLPWQHAGLNYVWGTGGISVPW